MVVRSTLIFAGVYAVSFVLAYAAGVQVAGYFFLEEEFGAVLFASALFSLVAIAVFAVVYAVQPNVRWLGYAALGLALVAFGVAQIPALLDALALRSTNPYLVGSAQDRAIAASFLLPAFVIRFRASARRRAAAGRRQFWHVCCTSRRPSRSR
jgi:hypothetical protein